MELLQYLLHNLPQVYQLLIQHIELTALSVGIAILIGVPLGILISYVKPMKKPVMAMTNLMQAIPSMALLGFVIPFMGIGKVPAVFAVVLYSLLPIVKNSYIGVSQIDRSTIEVAKGIGMTRTQILCRIQLPLMLPVLMAGIRIAAVTAVGLMTIAAYIGAGGLGYLVFTGISVVNNGMIVAGAIPAAILALFLDAVLGLIEELVTPISLQPSALQHREAFEKSLRYKKVLIGLSAILLIGVIGHGLYYTHSKGNNEIVLATKPMTEQLIIGNMVKDLIEADTDIKVIPKFGFGSTSVLQSALNNGNIDMYPDYTGTLYVSVLKHKPISDAQKVYDTTREEMLKKYHQVLLAPFAFENTYAIAVTKQTAEAYHLKTMSDLAREGNQLVAGMTLDFLNREDGLPGLEKFYAFKMKDAKGIQGSNRYLAVEHNDVQVVDGFSTDGLLKKFNLVTLKDDKHFFPPYYGVMLINEKVLKEHPQIKKVIAKLAPLLTTERMRALNYEVDQEGKAPAAVAKAFLEKEGLLKK